MKCSAIHKEFLTWSIDHRGEDIPKRYRTHLEECESCRTEFGSIHQWVRVLQPQVEWTPEEGFYDRLVEGAMREKRRAAITESTRRDLALDTTGFFSIFQRSGLRFAPVAIVLLLVLTPLTLYINNSISTIGEFKYTSGHVIAQANAPLQTRKDDPIRKGTTLHTPIDTESVVLLESGAEVCVAPRSRLTFIGKRTVRVELGRAYFDMPKQKHGFDVLLPNGTVRVLGTAFAVEVTKDETVVTVTRGLVEVDNERAKVSVRSGNKSVLKPNQTPTMEQAKRIRQTIRWVTALREKRNQEELRTYYPSLAAPTPKGSRP